MKLISIFQFWLKSKQNVIIEYKLSDMGIHKKILTLHGDCSDS